MQKYAIEILKGLKKMDLKWEKLKENFYIYPDEEAFHQMWCFVGIVSLFPVSFSQFESKNLRKKIKELSTGQGWPVYVCHWSCFIFPF